MPPRERSVERRLTERVRQSGGISVKIAPIAAGLPDRLILLPGGKLRLVEVKAPGGVLRPAQQAFIERAARLGIPVAVLRSNAEIDEWLTSELQEVRS